MAEDESTAEQPKKKKRSDHTEVEFEFGNIEFEAKGRSVVVERMFRLLLEKIETGSLVASFTLQDDEEEEEEEQEPEEEEGAEESEEEEEAQEESLPETELTEEVPEPVVTGDDSVKPPPAWDSLETAEPEVSDAEREELDIE
jgi:hypothetical protein